MKTYTIPLQANCGYADLLLAYKDGGDAALATVARLLGYAHEERKPPELPPPAITEPSPQSFAPPGEETVQPLAETPFLQLVGYETRAEVASPIRSEWQNVTDTRPARPASVKDLSPWSTLVPRMRRSFLKKSAGRAPDIDAMIRRIGEGWMLERVPRRLRRRWGQAVQIIVDRSDRLTPFQEDLDRAAARLAALFPCHGVEFALTYDADDDPVLLGRGNAVEDYRLPNPGTLVVVLGDLGCLAGDAARVTGRWEALGQRLAQCRRVALTPCPSGCWLPDALRSWTMLAWESRTTPVSASDRRARAERLLRLLSPAIRIEPGLLRDIRLLLGADADAGTEADVWGHHALIGRSRVAATMDPAEAVCWREQLAEGLDKHLWKGVVQAMQRWRSGLADEVWFEELLNLPPSFLPELPEAIQSQDLVAARQHFKKLASELERKPGGTSYYRRLSERAWSAYHNQPDRELRVAQHRMYALACQDASDAPPPPNFDPASIPPLYDQPIKIDLRQQACRVVATPGVGSLLGWVRSRNGLVHVGETPFWKSGTPPTWAREWGRDEFGAWVTFEIEGVTQRMRWIPPGQFLMGSPEDDEQAFDEEKPQHSVTISRGFWMFDTVCTQELFDAVMKKKAKPHERPKWPITRVSWDDVHDFLEQINEALPGLNLSLPTEAQWEYACRAGTTTPFSFGETINADQAEYYDSHKRPSNLVDVATLPPNPWGLYELHGNVWEWCADGMRDYGTEPKSDPWTPLRKRTLCVIRGGSYLNEARRVRAASRNGVPLRTRLETLGFRCARVQEGAEPIDVVGGESALLRLDLDEPVTQCSLPRSASFQVITDCEKLTFARITQPTWAEAVGRDQFGLWADIAVGDVRQRLRWIPPGQFLMGSPEDEPGRFDWEEPQHMATISQGYWLFDTPCTQALWQVVMKDNRSRFKTPNRPVENVSWNDAQEFIGLINKRGLSLSLPTETQWEYACRANNIADSYSGYSYHLDDIVNVYDVLNIYTLTLDDIAWYSANSGGETHPVGLKFPNGWGLYDMLGNVNEWCLSGKQDYGIETKIHHNDAFKTGTLHVFRGGSWLGDARHVRAAHRDLNTPDDRYEILGFRCVIVQA